jgi:hypothetical protein
MIQKSTFNLMPWIAVEAMIFIIITTSCSSHRYGAYFNDTSKSSRSNHLGEEREIASISKAQSYAPNKDELLATTENKPMIKTEKNLQTGLAKNQIHASKKVNQLSHAEIKSIKHEIKEAASKFRKAEKPDRILTTNDMPRYKYLTWAAGLLLAGLLFVAFSSSASVLGVLASLAFTGALVFFILWLVKK